MAGRVLFDRVMIRGLRLLPEAGQRVELADDGNRRLAGAEGGDERGGNAATPAVI